MNMEQFSDFGHVTHKLLTCVERVGLQESPTRRTNGGAIMLVVRILLQLRILTDFGFYQQEPAKRGPLSL